MIDIHEQKTYDLQTEEKDIVLVNNLKNPACDTTPDDYMPQKIFELYEQGHVGVKSGKGFYDYEGKPESELCAVRDEKLLKMLKFAMDLGDALPSKSN